MRNEFVQALLSQAEKNERIWLLTGDLGFTVLEPFRDRFPKRFVNVGVAEQNLAGIAAGLAHSGLMPFIYSIANFPIIRCLEQLRNDVAYHHLPVRMVSVGGGLAYGSAGYTHHGVEDLAIMQAIVGMGVLAPADGEETAACVDALANHIEGPAFLRLGKGGEPKLHPAPPSLQKGVLTLREGKDVCLLATGAVAAQALQAADLLKEKQVEAKVLSLPVLSPFHKEAFLQAIAKCDYLVLIEEHMGSSCFARLYEECYGELAQRGVKLLRLNLPASLRETIGTREYLLAQAGLDAAGICQHTQCFLKI